MIMLTKNIRNANFKKKVQIYLMFIYNAKGTQDIRPLSRRRMTFKVANILPYYKKSILFFLTLFFSPSSFYFFKQYKIRLAHSVLTFFGVFVSNTNVFNF